MRGARRDPAALLAARPDPAAEGPSTSAAELPAGLPAGLGGGPLAVVTGCAGFIGSHLCEALLAIGCRVRGIDSLNDTYDPALKRENLAGFRRHERFTFLEQDLLAVEAAELLAGADYCFHLAAQAGVRASWGAHFQVYLDRNLAATQRLLEACLAPAVAGRLRRLVYSSSSSVYGDQDELPVAETALPRPHSPYGVTKLAAEHLCGLYAANHGLPVTSLRYFTVYGPRQRPDMAFRRYLEAALDGGPFRLLGDGGQTRDFTYVGDAVRANLLAARETPTPLVVNIGGGERIALRRALDLLQELVEERSPGARPRLERGDVVAGDVRDTYADPALAARAIGYAPRTGFAEGLEALTRWTVARRRHHA